MRFAVIMTMLLCAISGAQAQRSILPAAKKAKIPAAQHSPAVMPQEFAPPQEAYASFPEAGAATAAARPSVCQLNLAKAAEFQPLPILVGPGDCGANDAVQLDAITLSDRSKIAVSPPAILRCPMAQEVADWVRDDVAPSLKSLPPLRALDNFASYDCRGRNNVRAAKVSEHGRADALDVRDFKLADGRALVLTDINLDKDWREAIRTSACARFMTVLGPGSDGYHEEHIHLDLEPRRNNYKICEWDVRIPPPPAATQSKEAEAKDADAGSAGGVPLQEIDAPALPADQVPLPRPRPVAQIERRLHER